MSECSNFEQAAFAKGHESQATKLWEEKGLLPLEEQV